MSFTAVKIEATVRKIVNSSVVRSLQTILTCRARNAAALCALAITIFRIPVRSGLRPPLNAIAEPLAFVGRHFRIGFKFRHTRELAHSLLKALSSSLFVDIDVDRTEGLNFESACREHPKNAVQGSGAPDPCAATSRTKPGLPSFPPQVYTHVAMSVFPAGWQALSKLTDTTLLTSQSVCSSINVDVPGSYRASTKSHAL